VALGCIGALAVVAVLVFIVVLGVQFAESGADTGRTVLDVPEAYGRPSVTRVGDRQVWLVRTRAGRFFALADLDAANRAAVGRRCRVNPIADTNSELVPLLQQYVSVLSAPAAETPLLFREDCNGAIYDAAGVRLDGPGPNLDRYETSVDELGRLVFEAGKRLCTAREGGDAFAAREC
jgi:hypothetical protein